MPHPGGCPSPSCRERSGRACHGPRGPLEAALLTLLRSRDRKPGPVSASNRPGNKETLPHVSGAAAPDSAKFPSRPDPGCDFMRTLPDPMRNMVADGLADPLGRRPIGTDGPAIQTL